MGAADEADDEIRDFDPNYWVYGELAAVTPAVAADTDAQHHGDGGAVSDNLAMLDDEEVDSAFDQNKLMRQLKVADCVFKGMEGAVGASLRHTIAAVMSLERKRFASHAKNDSRVAAELHERDASGRR